MVKFKLIIKNIYNYIFTIDENTKKSNRIISRKNHIKYRLILIAALTPIIYAIFTAYVDYGFTLYGTFKLLLLLLLIRFIGKEFIDAIISIFFYKSSYQISIKERRKLKLNKINRFRLFK